MTTNNAFLTFKMSAFLVHPMTLRRSSLRGVVGAVDQHLPDLVPLAFAGLGQDGADHRLPDVSWNRSLVWS